MKRWWLGIGITVLAVASTFVLQDSHFTKNLKTSVFSSEKFTEICSDKEINAIRSGRKWLLRVETCDNFEAPINEWQELWDFWFWVKQKTVGEFKERDIQIRSVLPYKQAVIIIDGETFKTPASSKDDEQLKSELITILEAEGYTRDKNDSEPGGLTKISGKNYDGYAQLLQTSLETVQRINRGFFLGGNLEEVNELICQICVKQRSEFTCPSCP